MSENWDELTKQAIDWARRSAVIADRKDISLLDMGFGIIAITLDGKWPQDALLKCLDRASKAEIQFKSDVVHKHKDISAKLHQEGLWSPSKLPIDEKLRSLLGEVLRKSESVEINVLASELFKVAPECLELIDFPLNDENTVSNDAGLSSTATEDLSHDRGDVPKGKASQQPSDMRTGTAHTPSTVEYLIDCTQKASQLEERLKSVVIGQDYAASMLTDSYFRALLGSQPMGPKGIFTFLGPPGCGKTLLAEAFGDALSDLEGSGYKFKRFNMGSFSGHQNFEQLFGAESFYKGAQSGTLTGFVDKNNKSVLLFDEIEKAHENTLNALLAILDSGEVEDKLLKKMVSFKDTWIIFTTNLGREYFDSQNETGIVSTSRQLMQSAVYDLLASAKKRVDIHDEDAVEALPSEFVSRLAKGGAVVFNKLEVRHLMMIFDKVLEEQGKNCNRIFTFPSVAVSHEAKILFLLSLLPKLDARRVDAMTISWCSDLIRDSIQQHKDKIQTDGAQTLCVNVKCSTDVKKYVKDLRSKAMIKVLVIDDSDEIHSVLQQSLKATNLEITHSAPSKDVSNAEIGIGADLVFLDLSINTGPDSSDVASALNIISNIRATNPEVPLWLFSENPEKREDFESVLGEVLAIGGARGFIPVSYKDQNSSQKNDAIRRFREICDELVYERIVGCLMRRNRSVTFSSDHKWDSKRKRLEIELVRVNEHVVVSADDQVAEISFKGIPDERFDDVIGLSRAKRRLGNILEWLKDSSKLQRFGVDLPRGYLLDGPPGTGKTLLARALAGEADIPFMALSAGELSSKWFGESEQRVRDLFQRARDYAPSIIFIDEIDALASDRKLDRYGHDSKILNQLLACIDGFNRESRPVFLLAATNRADRIDEALLRPGRFDEVIPIDLPNKQDRLDFFKMRLSGIKCARSIDVESISSSTSGCSPAELDRMIREAAYTVASTGRDEITQEDLEISRKLVMYGAKKESITITKDEQRITAYHEAAHAIVQHALLPQKKIEHLTITPHENGALGFLAVRSEDALCSLTLSEIRGKIAVLLAGREGEITLAGDIEGLSTGVSSDLKRATMLAYSSIANWGLDDVIGPISVESLPVHARTERMADVNAQVTQWLRQAREVSEKLLKEHKSKFEKLTLELMAKESMDADAIYEILNN